VVFIKKEQLIDKIIIQVSDLCFDEKLKKAEWFIIIDLESLINFSFF
jgi:hypothetical protein